VIDCLSSGPEAGFAPEAVRKWREEFTLPLGDLEYECCCSISGLGRQLAGRRVFRRKVRLRYQDQFSYAHDLESGLLPHRSLEALQQEFPRRRDSGRYRPFRLKIVRILPCDEQYLPCSPQQCGHDETVIRHKKYSQISQNNTFEE
jgi:hypothetical protein